MVKQIQLSILQREKALISLVSDAHILGFNKDLIQRYATQLKQIQKEIKRDKKQIKLYVIERRLK